MNRTESSALGLNSRQRIVVAATGIVSLLFGEALFKFGSFTLEVIAFLATWALLAKTSLFFSGPTKRD